MLLENSLCVCLLILYSMHNENGFSNYSKDILWGSLNLLPSESFLYFLGFLELHKASHKWSIRREQRDSFMKSYILLIS